MHNDAQHQKQTESADASGAASVDSLTGPDHREVVWPKFQVLKDKYLEDIKELYCILSQHSTKPILPEHLQMLKDHKDALQRMIYFLTEPEERVPRECNLEQVEAFEKQLVYIMETFRETFTRQRRTPGQQPALPPQQQFQPNSDWIVVPRQLPQQQQAGQQAQFKTVDSSTCLDNREVVWSKLQVLKDKYLQDIEEFYCILSDNSTTPPMPPEYLQMLKDVLQGMIFYLIEPKENVPREINLELIEAFEKQIVNIMESYKRPTQTPARQPALPPEEQLQPNSDWIVVLPQPPQQQQQAGQQAQQQQILQQPQQQPSLQHILSQMWRWRL